VESIVVTRDASNVEVVVSGTIFIYHADKPCIKKVYRFEPQNLVPLNAFQQCRFDENGQFVMDPGYTEQLSITRYDARYNILEQQKFNSPKEVFLWGYDYQYPVAKIINSDYATIRSIVEPGVLVAPANDEDLRNEINKIRIALANAKAQVISYTYSPLVGMTSETDVNNKTTYYEYDGFGRLNVIRDQDKNVVKKLCYKYDGVNEDCSVVYYNAPRSIYITPVCSPGLTGKPYLYTVDAGTFSSTISQDDVEQKVTNDIQTNGQTQANQKGTCTANPTLFQNIEQSVLISSLNCGEGETGVPFKYIVPSNKYSSLISQEDADDKALNEIKVYAQDYANDHGQCTDQVPVILRSEHASIQESYVQIINEYEDVVEELQFPVNRSAGMQVIFLPPGSYRFTFSAPRNLSGYFNNFFYSVLPDDYQWFLADGYNSNAWRYLDTDYVTFTFGDYYILTSALF
jgi:YD repeat-containing protein